MFLHSILLKDNKYVEYNLKGCSAIDYGIFFQGTDAPLANADSGVSVIHSKHQDLSPSPNVIICFAIWNVKGF